LFIFFFLFRSDTFDGAWTGGERDLERELERVLERDLTRDLLRDLDLERDLEEEEEGDDFFRKAVEPNGFVCPLSLKEIWGLEVAIACGFNAVIPPNPVPILNGEFPAGELLLNGVVGKPAPPVLKPPTPLFNAFVGVESTPERFGRGSLSQSLSNAVPSLDDLVILPLSISSTRSLSTELEQMAKQRST